MFQRIFTRTRNNLKIVKSMQKKTIQFKVNIHHTSPKTLLYHQRTDRAQNNGYKHDRRKQVLVPPGALITRNTVTRTSLRSGGPQLAYFTECPEKETSKICK